MSGAHPDWSAERTEQLRKHHAAGLSFSAIGEMWGLSRSAIAGKCARLKLTRPYQDAAASGRAGGKKSARMRRLSKPPKQVSKFNFARKVVAGPTRVAAVTSVLPPPDVPPPFPMKNIPLVKLKSHHCRWPVGDPREADFGYCGIEKHSGSYCAYHAQIAYQPAVKR